MKKIFVHVIVLLYLSFVIGHVSLVKAAYVLPYPSYMPGNKLYTIGTLIDKIKGYWAFGTLAQTKYQMQLADKYLVEAKTLFEYHQYLLASSALARSDSAFSTLPKLVHSAKTEGKSTVAIVNMISEEATEHTRILEIMKNSLPDVFTWSPEKAKSTELSLHDIVQTAIDLRASVSVDLKVL